MKSKRGITLIALVVTIIILIILAGVSINILLVDGGLIDKVGQAKENTEIAANEEREDLDKVANWIEGNTGGGTGSGEEEREPGPIETEPKPDYIPIYTKEDLRKVATGDGTTATEYEIKGVKYDMLPTSKYMLMNNIDLKDYIGSDGNNSWDPILNFAGTFDGNGCAIYNLTIDRPNATGNQALFVTELPETENAEEQPKIEITKLSLIDINITATTPVAGIIAVDNANVDISDCTVKGNLTSNSTSYGGSSVCGICFGGLNSNISKCNVYGNLKATGQVKGIGTMASVNNEGDITDCNVYANIEADESFSGIGYAKNIKNCEVRCDNMISQGSGGSFGIGTVENSIEDCKVYVGKMENTSLRSNEDMYGIGLAKYGIKKCNVNIDTINTRGRAHGIGEIIQTNVEGEVEGAIEDCSVKSNLIQAYEIRGIGLIYGNGQIRRCTVEIGSMEITNSGYSLLYGIGHGANIVEDCYVHCDRMYAPKSQIQGIGPNNSIKRCIVEVGTMYAQSVIYGIGGTVDSIEDCLVRCNLIQSDNTWDPVIMIGSVKENCFIKRCSAKINKIQSENMFGLGSGGTIENSYAMVNNIDCNNIKLFGSSCAVNNSYAAINIKPESEHTYTSCALKNYTYDTINNTVTYEGVTNSYTNANMVYPEGTNTAEEPFSKTIDQLKDKATFTGWNETIWAFDANKNGGFPYLKGGDEKAI